MTCDNIYYITFRKGMLQGQSYVQTPYRFVVLTAYLLAALVNCLPMQTFSSINVAVEGIFKISSTMVTLNALLFNLAHPILAFPCNWLINRYGMHKSFILGGALVISGAWLRLLIEQSNFTYVLIGSCLAAAGNMFIINTPSKLATNWFSEKSSGLVASCGVAFTLVSGAAGAALPGFFINENVQRKNEIIQNQSKQLGSLKLKQSNSDYDSRNTYSNSKSLMEESIQNFCPELLSPDQTVQLLNQLLKKVSKSSKMMKSLTSDNATKEILAKINKN